MNVDDGLKQRKGYTNIYMMHLFIGPQNCRAMEQWNRKRYQLINERKKQKKTREDINLMKKNIIISGTADPYHKEER